MKAANPLWWHVLAVPFTAAGGVIVLLIVWALLAICGSAFVDGPVHTPSRDALPFAHASPTAATTTWAHARPAFQAVPREWSAEERLAASADLLEFIGSIRLHPVPGGHYLALKAYDFCTREARLTLDAMSGTIAESGTIATGRQLEAQAGLARLCGTFRYRNVAALDYYLLAEEGLQMRDARLIAARRLERMSAQWDTSSHDDSPSRQTLIADVLTSGDGWLIRDLAGEFEVILHTGQLMIGGQLVDPAESQDAIDALWIMACEYGAPCSRDGEWQRMLACASAGECAPAPAIATGNALRWRNRIREALLAGAAGIDVVPVAEQRY